MAANLIVRVTLMIDVDPEAWEQEYGIGPEEAHIREDVRAYVLCQLQDSAAAESGAVQQVKLVRERLDPVTGQVVVR
jgi:hypothetical protein